MLYHAAFLQGGFFYSPFVDFLLRFGMIYTQRKKWVHLLTLK